jgi:hypothetical protein
MTAKGDGMKKLLVAAMIASQLPAIASPAFAQRRPAARPACAPAPTLALSERFNDPRRIFGPNSPGMRATRAEFEIAYQRACREGLLRRGNLMNGNTAFLYLINSPDANVASIHPISVRGNRGLNGTGLEYPFVTHEGTLNVPNARDLHEAIYCRVVGATPREQEEEGRCLPD